MLLNFSIMIKHYLDFKYLFKKEYLYSLKQTVILSFTLIIQLVWFFNIIYQYLACLIPLVKNHFHLDIIIQVNYFIFSFIIHLQRKLYFLVLIALIKNHYIFAHHLAFILFLWLSFIFYLQVLFNFIYFFLDLY